MRYMLLIYGCQRPEEGSPEQAAKVGEIKEFTEECRRRGVYRGGDPLYTVETASTVRVRGGESLVTDGPFAETYEQLGGYYMLECEREEALELAARCPMAAEGSVEVRPVIDVPWLAV